MQARILAPLLALIALAAVPRAGDVSLFVGEPGGVGSVWILGADASAPPTLPPELQGIRLLAFDVTGRTPLTELLDTTPRLRSDVPGASRVLLPTVGSSLYRYRRDFPDGSALFGFFLIGADGRARPLGALPGGGVQSHVDPLAGRLAVSPEGDALLLATRPGAGGDLYEMDLGTGEWTVHTADLPPQHFGQDGLCLLDTWGAALTNNGLVRFGRQPESPAVLVPFTTGAPAWVGGELVCSADQSTIAFAAGDSPSAAFVHVANVTGAVRRVSHQPQEVLDAGFLPATAAGPRLALAPDGSRVAWVARYGVYNECFSRPVTQNAAPTHQITADANFIDTLNDSGVISFFSPDELLLLVGRADQNATPGIDKADVFRADFRTATPTYTNLTVTDGNAMIPFDYGKLRTSDGILRIPQSASLLIVDRGRDRLVRLEETTGTVELVLDDVDSVHWGENVAGRLLVNVRREGLAARHNLLEVGAQGSSVLLDAAPSLRLSRRAISPVTGALAAVLRDRMGGEYLGRIEPSGAGGLLATVPLVFGPTVGFATDGAIVASLPTQNGAVFMRWLQGGVPTPLWPTELSGFLLPGN